MKYNVIVYLISEGFKNIFKNKKSTMASLTIMCATMLIFGVFFIIGENINFSIKHIESEQGLQAFLFDVSDEEIENINVKIKAIEGVNTTKFLSKQDALEQMKKRFKDKPELLEGRESIFSVSYFVTLTDLSLEQSVREKILEIDNIKKVESGSDTISKLKGFGTTTRLVTFIILILLIAISVFIIANTIKLAVHARRKEISIMKYVGATNAFIRFPFIVEGVIIGIISGLFSILIVGVIYNKVIQTLINTSLQDTLGIQLVTFSEMFRLIILVYMFLGIGIGIVGSVISMRKYLKV